MSEWVRKWLCPRKLLGQCKEALKKCPRTKSTDLASFDFICKNGCHLVILLIFFCNLFVILSNFQVILSFCHFVCTSFCLTVILFGYLVVCTNVCWVYLVFFLTTNFVTTIKNFGACFWWQQRTQSFLSIAFTAWTYFQKVWLSHKGVSKVSERACEWS